MRISVLTSVVRRRTVLAVAAMAMPLALSACGDNGASPDPGADPGAVAASSAPTNSATVNDTDVSFAHAMIPHHRQAVQMAANADGRASNEQVKQLAAKVKATQRPEIDMMNGWLIALNSSRASAREEWSASAG